MARTQLGQRIKQCRENNKCTQNKLAGELKVTQQAIASWESGRTEPNAETLIKIADFFDVSVDYLVGRIDIPNQITSSNNPAVLAVYKNVVTMSKRQFERMVAILTASFDEMDWSIGAGTAKKRNG